MDLFTIDNVGEAELLDLNIKENNSVKFERKVDALSEVHSEDVKGQKAEEDVAEEEEEDENLSDVDFGGKKSFDK